jgi:MoxR-like ATPase
MVQLVMATRSPQAFDDKLAEWIRYGASPRGTLALDRCSKAYAWLCGRNYVTPDDIQTIAHDVLRHRILLTYEAEAEGVTTDDVVNTILKKVAVP